MKIKIEDFDSTEFEIRDYDLRKIEKEQKYFEEVKKFYDCEMFVEFRGNDPVYFDKTEIYLKHPSLILTITFWDFTKKHSIYCNNISYCQDVESNCKERAKKGIKEPNKIGKLSTKKIEEWIKFYEDWHKNLIEIQAENRKKIQDFYDSVKILNVVWSNQNRKSGYAKRNGIIINFEVQTTYVSKKISLDRSLKDEIKTFLELSDNKLNFF